MLILFGQLLEKIGLHFTVTSGGHTGLTAHIALAQNCKTFLVSLEEKRSEELISVGQWLWLSWQSGASDTRGPRFESSHWQLLFEPISLVNYFKKLPVVWATFFRNCITKKFKTRPIWSLCSLATLKH